MPPGSRGMGVDCKNVQGRKRLLVLHKAIACSLPSAQGLIACRPPPPPPKGLPPPPLPSCMRIFFCICCTMSSLLLLLRLPPRRRPLAFSMPAQRGGMGWDEVWTGGHS